MTDSALIQTTATSLLRQHGESVMRFVAEFLQTRPNVPDRLMQAIRYSVDGGGKRLRPGLVMVTFESCLQRGKNDPDHQQLLSSALASAGAMELIHTFSLVHDDLPAMDNDDLRRGRATNHKVFGEAMAILAGDAMVTLAFELIAECACPTLVAPLVAELARSAGPGGMIGGQALDIDSENRVLNIEQLRQLHRLKTGALILASCRLGAMCARAENNRLAAITKFGQHLGLAFQIIDDVLDVTSTPEELGKGTQKDQGKGKNTYPSLLGLETSAAQAQDEIAAALQAIEPLGATAEPLRALAQFVVDRQV